MLILFQTYIVITTLVYATIAYRFNDYISDNKHTRWPNVGTYM